MIEDFSCVVFKKVNYSSRMSLGHKNKKGKCVESESVRNKINVVKDEIFTTSNRDWEVSLLKKIFKHEAQSTVNQPF